MSDQSINRRTKSFHVHRGSHGWIQSRKEKLEISMTGALGCSTGVDGSSDSSLLPVFACWLLLLDLPELAELLVFKAKNSMNSGLERSREKFYQWDNLFACVEMERSRINPTTKCGWINIDMLSDETRRNKSRQRGVEEGEEKQNEEDISRSSCLFVHFPIASLRSTMRLNLQINDLCVAWNLLHIIIETALSLHDEVGLKGIAEQPTTG